MISAEPAGELAVMLDATKKRQRVELEPTPQPVVSASNAIAMQSKDWMAATPLQERILSGAPHGTELSQVEPGTLQKVMTMYSGDADGVVDAKVVLYTSKHNSRQC